MRDFIVSLLGARMHYAVPRIFHEAGHLESFFTDFSAARGWPRCLNMVPSAMRPPSLTRLLGRVPQGLPPAKIIAFNQFGWEYARRRRRAHTPTEQTAVFLWSGREFCRLVNESSWGNVGGVFTFNSAGLETLQKAKRQGLRTVMEQTIAPRLVEQQILEQEFVIHPDWQVQTEDSLVVEYANRERAEWAEADIILCGSQFVMDGIAQFGGPVEKCLVVPYGVDFPNQKSEVRSQKPQLGNRPLHVLTVGTVGLRKGAPTILEAARRLKGLAEFRWVGGVELLPTAAKHMAEYVQLTGAVPSSQMSEHFQWADVFLLPSLCEGSATVTYEAMAHGLPVICTPNTGSVVRDDLDGFIVPIRDSAAIANRIERLAHDRELLENSANNARSRAAQFTVAAYARRLLAALSNG